MALLHPPRVTASFLRIRATLRKVAQPSLLPPREFKRVHGGRRPLRQKYTQRTRDSGLFSERDTAGVGDSLVEELYSKEPSNFFRLRPPHDPTDCNTEGSSRTLRPLLLDAYPVDRSTALTRRTAFYRARLRCDVPLQRNKNLSARRCVIQVPPSQHYSPLLPISVSPFTRRGGISSIEKWKH